jgi:MFS family permease
MKSSTLALTGLIFAVSMTTIDQTIVALSAPSIQQNLGLTHDGMQWAVNVYLLTTAAFFLLGGRIADVVGHKRMALVGIAGFGITSLLCGLAPTGDLAEPWLVTARALQGVSGAIMFPAAIGIVVEGFARESRGRAMAIFFAITGAMTALGPIAGGYLTIWTWRAIFWVNVPVGLAVVAGAPRLLPNHRGAAARVDVAELLLATVTLTALLLPLMEGRRLDWPAWTWASLALAGASAVATYARGRTLVAHGLRPLVDPVAFRSSTVRVAVACQGLLFVGMASYFLVLALYLQLGRGLSALESGLVFTLVAIPYMAGTVAVPRVAARLGTRTVASGAVVFALGHVALWVAVRTDASVADLAPGLVLAGLGMGVALTSLIGAAMTGVEPATVGAVSGVLSTVQQVGNTLGVAVVGMVFFGGVTAGYDVAMAHSLLVLAGTTTAVALLATRLRPAVSSGRGPEVASSARPARPVGGGARRATG